MTRHKELHTAITFHNLFLPGLFNVTLLCDEKIRLFNIRIHHNQKGTLNLELIYYGWLVVSTHLKNISQNWIISPGRCEKKKRLKPPPSWQQTTNPNLPTSKQISYQPAKPPDVKFMLRLLSDPMAPPFPWKVRFPFDETFCCSTLTGGIIYLDGPMGS